MMHAAALDRAELGDWLRLVDTPGVRRAQVRRLLAAFGLPQAVFAASPAALATVVGPVAAGALLAATGRGHAESLARADDWRNHPNCQLLTLADPAYPPALLQTPDPPPLLYVEGCLHWLHAPAIAVVGSRHASAQGLAHARAFAQALAHAGLTVISGLALGIDGAAHQGALAANGATVAVLGTGVDRVYPERHRGLARELAERGALLSEWPLGAAPLPSHFPQRNRLIAGLARGVLVVEATARSGSLITARLATEMGRDVFAIPGSIHSALSKGCHSLIKEGAKLIESVDDVLEEFGSLPAPACDARDPARPLAALDTDAQAVLHALGHDAAAVDLLSARCELDPARVQTALLQLELAQRVSVLPCGRIAPLITPPITLSGTHRSDPAIRQQAPARRETRQRDARVSCAASPAVSPDISPNLSLDLSPPSDTTASEIEP